MEFFAALLLAIFCAATSFPFIGRWPVTSTVPADTWPRIREPGRWYHDLKNLLVELFRADPQWWAKASACSVVTLLLALAGSLIW